MGNLPTEMRPGEIVQEINWRKLKRELSELWRRWKVLMRKKGRELHLDNLMKMSSPSCSGSLLTYLCCCAAVTVDIITVIYLLTGLTLQSEQSYPLTVERLDLHTHLSVSWSVQTCFLDSTPTSQSVEDLTASSWDRSAWRSCLLGFCIYWKR